VSSAGDLPAGPGAAGWQPVRHVGASLRAGEIVSLLGALVLLAAMATLRWYGAAGAGGIERAGPSHAISAWQALTVTRWLMVATIAATLGASALRAGRGGRSQRPGPAGAIVLAGSATALVLAYRVLINPPQPDRVFDVKLGAALGLAGAVAIAAGNYESWRSARPGPAVRGGPAPAGRRPAE
jgi:hypothetical protein